MSTFIRAFAVMLALTGFSAVSYSGSGSSASAPQAKAMGGPGMGGAPVCTNPQNNCGLDGN